MSWIANLFRRQSNAERDDSPSTVPAFRTYYPSVAQMTPEQRRFYEYLKNQLSKGRAPDVGDNISYLFCYCYETQETGDLRRVYDVMVFLSDAYKSNDKVSSYCRDWAIDALVGMGELRTALNEFPVLCLNRSGSLRTDLLLSLKYALGEKISGRDVLTLNGPHVTKYAMSHLEGISDFIESILAVKAKHDGDIITGWVKKYRIEHTLHHMFNGSVQGRPAQRFQSYWFSRTYPLLDLCASMTREAENTFREEQGIPRIGEGWVAETELYYAIKKAFPDLNVVQHGRPAWLGRQHLDVYIEQIGVALEYQGAQHFSPVSFFGGEQAFLETQKRDRRKLHACSRHGVKIFYVEEGYSRQAVIDQIRERMQAASQDQ
jgi:hypothetical protein